MKLDLNAVEITEVELGRFDGEQFASCSARQPWALGKPIVADQRSEAIAFYSKCDTPFAVFLLNELVAGQGSVWPGEALTILEFRNKPAPDPVA